MSVADSFTRRQILNQRFASFLGRKYGDKISELYGRIAARIARERNPDRLSQIADDLQRILNLGFQEISSELRQDILDFAGDEADIAVKIFNANSRVPFRIPDIEAIEASLMINQLSPDIGSNAITMAEALEEFEKSQTAIIRQIISDSVVLGETLSETAGRIRTVATSRPKHQTQALVRTLTNHAASQARRRVEEEHIELFSHDEWLAVLDSRTTLICSGRDGRQYPIGKGPYPPAHWNCRSIRSPVLKPEFQTQKQGLQRREFDSWLRGQSAAFQDEYFSQFANGKELAVLFRRGKLPVQSFRDETGRQYTRDELRNLYPVVFNETGLNEDPPTGG